MMISCFQWFPQTFFALKLQNYFTKNRFVTLFLIRFSYNFQKILPNSSRIGKCKIYVLTLGFSYPKRVKRPKTQLRATKIAKFLARANYLEIKLILHVYHKNKAFNINTV